MQADGLTMAEETAAAEVAQVINEGDTAWMLVATGFVLLCVCRPAPTALPPTSNSKPSPSTTLLGS